MTLYTILPLEIVLQEAEGKSEEMLEVWSGNVRMQVVPVAPGVGRMVRLLDCQLNDYLNPAYTPGALVQYELR